MTCGVSRHLEVLRALRVAKYTRNRMPTTKELCHELRIHRSVLDRVLKDLVKRGDLIKHPRRTLSYEVK